MTAVRAANRKFKIVLVGDAGVGKTALAFRFTDGVYIEPGITYGIEIRSKTVHIEDETIEIQIWESAEMNYGAHFYQNAHAVILAYDITHQNSYRHLSDWLEKVRKECPENAIIIMVGNKCDEKAVVDTQLAQRFADAHGMPLFETSAKLDSEKLSVDGIFMTIVHKLKANATLRVNRDSLLHAQQTRSGSRSWFSYLSPS